jgi:hypothetical protein
MLHFNPMVKIQIQIPSTVKTNLHFNAMVKTQIQIPSTVKTSFRFNTPVKTYIRIRPIFPRLDMTFI